MCGIFGFVGMIDAALASQCLATLVHRGPDGEGLWSEPGVTLGHRRLAILDLSEIAAQPMADPAGRYQIVFNGEIYNFVELRRELEALGHAFRTRTDSEVLLTAYIEWGEGCQTRLNGMWAFAIWDREERSLFLSRDRFGEKPLFYARTRRGLAFASEMKALLPILDEIRPNSGLIRDQGRMFTYESTSECLLEGVVRLPAGHCAKTSKDELIVRRWWCTLDHLPEVPVLYEEQVEQFRELFLDSCRLRMRSDVPIGTALSGGLDSSATICAMGNLARRSMPDERMGADWQHAFVASFPGTPLDEVRYAKVVANHLNIPLEIVSIDPGAMVSDLEQQLYLFEELYITSPIPFMGTYGAVKSAGISVTLDGHGADELFGGYSFDYLFALKDAGFNVRQALEIVDTYYDAWPTESPQFASLPDRRWFLVDWHLRRLARLVLRRNTPLESRDKSHPKWNHLDNLSKQLYVSAHETVLPTLLRNYDRYSMANGVEIRMPFLDHRIAAFAMAVPWTSKIRNGFSKSIVRDGMAPYMPSEITWRKSKIGFNSPVVDWMKGPLREYLLDVVNCTDFHQCELIAPKLVREAIQRVVEQPDARFADGERAWSMLMPFLWQEAFLKRSDRV